MRSESLSKSLDITRPSSNLEVPSYAKLLHLGVALFGGTMWHCFMLHAVTSRTRARRVAEVSRFKKCNAIGSNSKVCL